MGRGCGRRPQKVGLELREVWAAVAENVHRRVPLEIAVKHLGPPTPLPPHAPDAQAFADRDYFRSVLAAAGFADIAIEPKRFNVVGASVSGIPR